MSATLLARQKNVEKQRKTRNYPTFHATKKISSIFRDLLNFVSRHFKRTAPDNYPMLKLYNTLTNRVEDFQPLNPPEARMYVCGPTVYDFAHIGNFRTFLFTDLLRRYLKYKGYDVRHVMNITDVDDKIMRNAVHEHKSVNEYTRKYEEAFLEDMCTLSLEPPERMVRSAW